MPNLDDQVKQEYAKCKEFELVDTALEIAEREINYYCDSKIDSDEVSTTSSDEGDLVEDMNLGKIIFNKDTYEMIAPQFQVPYEDVPNSRHGIKFILSPKSKIEPETRETFLLIKKNILFRHGCKGEINHKIKVPKPNRKPPKVSIISDDNIPPC